MRPTILALSIFVAAGAMRAHANDLNPAPSNAPPQSVVAKKGADNEKPKDRILKLLDVTRALSRWTPNEVSFLSVLDGVQARVTAAKASELAPMDDFMSYLAQLTAALSRLEARMNGVQSPAELCDPARKKELFLTFLDALDVDGQLPVQARVCEKIAAEQSADSDLSQVCIGSSLAFFAARSVHDLTVACEPSLAREPSTGAGQIDRLSNELASVKASLQDSVRSSKLEVTKAMTFATGYMAEVSSTQTKQIEDLAVRFEIERALQQGVAYASLYLPEANGGRLELVRSVVSETIQNVLGSGESANGASEKLAAADAQRAARQYKDAFRLYCAAYKTAVAPATPSPKQAALPPAPKEPAAAAAPSPAHP